jgi:uncharacterized C2H2 Zn-finger protein
VPTIVTSGFDLDACQCTICNKVFKSDKTLMGHMITHFGVGPRMARCPVCDLTLQKKSYARHLRLHSSNPHPCTSCPARFPTAATLAAHVLAAHTVAPQPVAPAVVVSRAGVAVSSAVGATIMNMGGPFTCGMCEKIFYTEEVRLVINGYIVILTCYMVLI